MLHVGGYRANSAYGVVCWNGRCASCATRYRPLEKGTVGRASLYVHTSWMDGRLLNWRTSLYGCIPERWASGKFDLCHTHVRYDCTVMAAIWVHFMNCVAMFDVKKHVVCKQ